MNKHMNCRCGICDHLNTWEGEYREFLSPDICSECYVAITSAMGEMLQEEELGYTGTALPLDARPEPTSGLLDPIQKEAIGIAEDSQGTRTV